jgi:hypothetical protein
MLIWGKARETSRLIIFGNNASRARAEGVSIIEIEYIRVTIDYYVYRFSNASVDEFEGRQGIIQ